MNPLKDFFDAERKRIIEPDVFFTHRFMARFDERSREKNSIGTLEFWDVVPSSTRPVLAIALVLILCFAAVEVFVPQVPERGMLESILTPEQSPVESFLYTDTDVASQDLLQQLIAPEE
jgi:hypothetical protein